MPLSLDHVHDVCLISDTSGKCCRYLSEEASNSSYHCLKKSNHKKQIDNEVKERSKFDNLIPKGDNCPGYPVFQHITVGYDCQD